MRYLRAGKRGLLIGGIFAALALTLHGSSKAQAPAIPEFGNANVSIYSASNPPGTYNSAVFTNKYGKGLVLGINITSARTGTATITVQGQDAASGQFYTLCATTGINTTGFKTLTIYPGLTAAANVICPVPLPASWRVNIVTTDTTTMTIGASVQL